MEEKKMNSQFYLYVSEILIFFSLCKKILTLFLS